MTLADDRAPDSSAPPAAPRPAQYNADLIRTFYGAFGRRDAEAMVACYDPAVTFTDEVFVDLRGERAGAMWRMLCGKADDLRVVCTEVHADESNGRAHWEAWYTFSATGRRVHNRIDAEFRFRDGRIIGHRDRFDFWAWATQALGPTGRFLGWTGAVREKVRATALKNLDRFIAGRA